MTKALFGTTFSLYYTHTSLRIYRDFGDSFEHFTSIHYQREVTPADVNCTDFPSIPQGQAFYLYSLLGYRSKARENNTIPTTKSP